MVTSENQLTGATAKQLREDRGLSQAKFWGAIGVSKGRAIAYENGRREMPPELRRLVYLHHVAGLPLDADPDSIAQYWSAIQALRERRAADRKLEQALKAMEETCHR